VAAPVMMPKFGQTMTEGTIVRWVKGVGESVRKGEVLLRIETDKSEMDVESELAGVVLKIDVAEGTTVECGATLAWIGKKGEKL
jgi:pyruvate/2-oxoglutarate dehydrogenase complex dihydrolipoamide acyltransferase (E2) component